MILIGEKLNSSIPSTRQAIERRDAEAIQALARRQTEAGAEWLDLNAGMFIGDETETLAWLAGTVAAGTDAGLVLDSPDPSVLAAVAPLLASRRLILNSATLDPARLEPMLALALEYGTGLVVLPIRGRRLPESVADQIDISEELIAAARTAGLSEDRLYLDILVSAAAIDTYAPSRALAFARHLRGAHPELHLTGGISNVSYGLPGRRPINASFLSASVQAGVDAPIFDVLDTNLLHVLAASVMIAGQDEYCADYLAFYRQRIAGAAPT